MVGMLTRPGSPISDQEARDQLLVFLFAGHDTTATALTFALHLLGSHPEIQDRAADEVCRVLGGRPPTAEDLTRLPYLGRIECTAVIRRHGRARVGRGASGRRAPSVLDERR
jgi:cytochrome P450